LADLILVFIGAIVILNFALSLNEALSGFLKIAPYNANIYIILFACIILENLQHINHLIINI
jgi:hypothetical protein